MQDPIVHLENVSIKNNHNFIFLNINLKVMPGDFIFLIGKTGTGKSSLIKVLHADLDITEGFADVVGFSINTIKEKQIPLLRRKIGVVFQDFKLLDDRNIFDNLAFILKATGWKVKNKISSRIDEVLKMVGVNQNTEKFPFELSGGEQQRLAIARALLNTPELIIADEPTGNLDPETSDEIMQLFKKLNSEGISIIMATHDYNMIMKYPGKIFKCENKKLTEVFAKKKTLS
jgi:cell division transport system ATP-binding protein